MIPQQLPSDDCDHNHERPLSVSEDEKELLSSVGQSLDVYQIIIEIMYLIQLFIFNSSDLVIDFW